MDRKKSEYSSGYFIEKAHWNEAKQRVNEKNNLHEDINNELMAIESKIFDIKRNLENEDKLVSTSIIKDILTEKHKLVAMVLESFDNYTDLLEKKGETKLSTGTRYNETKARIQDFLIEKKNIKDINVKYINYKFLEELDVFLSQVKVKHSDKTLSRNTVNKHLSRLRTILIHCMNNGFITSNPFSGYELKNTKSTIEYLEESEVKQLIEHNLGGNKSLQRVRDLFVFSCFTGLRYSDTQALTMDKVIIDKNGKYWIKTDTIKTSQFIGIPILKEAVKILDKYKNSPERKVKNLALPQISNQKGNAYLKTIADLVGIDKRLHHHVSRHSCGTYLVSKGYSLEMVAEWLGHESTRTTKIYAKITGKVLDKIRDELDAN